MNVLVTICDLNEELYEIRCDKHFIKFYYRKKNSRHRNRFYPYSSIYTIQKNDWKELLKHECPEDSGR